MQTLYHLWLDPECRKIRLVLAEKGMEVNLITEEIWERREDFLALNPACEVPVLLTGEGHPLADSGAIAEFLEEVRPEPALLPGEAEDRAEIRRLVAWFDRKMARESTLPLIEERVMKRFLGMGEPDSHAIRAGLANLHIHLDYIGWLAERRSWLAGSEFSLADCAAGAHLSCLDYIGDVPWDEHPGAHDWYSRIKSRPSFRTLLSDLIPGLPPPKHYADLDF